MGDEFRGAARRRAHHQVSDDAEVLSQPRPLPTKAPRAVYLYVPFTTADAFRPLRRSPWRRARNAVRRGLDLAQWRFAGRATAHYSTWEDAANSNVGDAAMAAALRALVREAKGAGVEPEVVEVGWGTLTPQRIDEINAKGERLLVAGGYFVVRADGSLSGRAREDLPLLARLRTPIVATGLGVNLHLDPAGRAPEIAPQARREMQAWFRLCARVGLRDASSIEIARALGVDAELMPDPVLILEPEEAPRRAPGRPPLIGVNLAFHKARPPGELERLLRAYIEALATVQTSHGARFVHFMHADSERFISRALRASGLQIRSVAGPAERLLPEYAALDAHLAQMMHSSILSVCAGAPVGVVAYDSKNAEFCRLAGLSDYVIPESAATPAALAGLIRRLLAEREAIASRMAEARAALRRRQQAFLRAALAA